MYIYIYSRIEFVFVFIFVTTFTLIDKHCWIFETTYLIWACPRWLAFDAACSTYFLVKGSMSRDRPTWCGDERVWID
ncbi:hypothetical protein F4775DRAFT_156943 [Biscogniauxia sp. FL1348]|nr:hypothetical protein F4775DRAFT_156943 [Biscogniauxia sp. FL1348]